MLQSMMKKARHSGFYRWMLNIGIARVIPFNAPHHFKITEVGEDSIRIKLPLIRKNKNHIGGMHACALATLCEYSTGLMLVSKIDESRYRIILKEIQIEYHYQAKMDVAATFTLTDAYIKADILEPLETQESILRKFLVEVHDSANNHICSGHIHWQIKDWKKVKTKV